MASLTLVVVIHNSIPTLNYEFPDGGKLPQRRGARVPRRSATFVCGDLANKQLNQHVHESQCPITLREVCSAE